MGLLEDMLREAFGGARIDVRSTGTTKTFPTGKMSYRYVSAGTDGRGHSVWFCWSCHRNTDGFFLSWREVRSAKGGRRDRWASRRVKKKARALAVRRRDAYVARKTKQ